MNSVPETLCPVRAYGGPTDGVNGPGGAGLILSSPRPAVRAGRLRSVICRYARQKRKNLKKRTFDYPAQSAGHLYKNK
jgi:hypothetical protein